MSDLSDRQSAIVHHIAVYISQKGYCPSFRDLSDAMGGISTNAIANHIQACVKKGYLSKVAGRARTLSLTEKATAYLKSIAPKD